jgi:sugar/nucleoside kinase (ribokinase family)
MSTALTQLAADAANILPRLAGIPVVSGFDGFVDEMIRVVDERQSLGDFRAVPSIERFGGWVSGAAGRSSLKEIVVERFDAGGCAVNLGDGLVSLGVALHLFATLGKPMAPAFASLAERCAQVESWGSQPGRTLAFEFDDGKLMFSSMSQLQEIDPALVSEALASGGYAEACAEAKAIALTNWTLYPHMTAVWKLLQEQVLGGLSHRPWLFIDLVDPRSRSESDIREMLETLKGFEPSCRAVLGVNLNEANAVAGLLGIDSVEEEEETAVREQAAAIRSELGISQVVTHCLKIAAVAEAEEQASSVGPYCPNPKKSVGAGDRFNAGYVGGLVVGLPAAQRLCLGNASSGFFVRNARSASPDELAAFIDAWAAGLV